MPIRRKEDEIMRRIAINMQNALFCNAIADTLRRSGNELEPYTIDSPDKVVGDCKWIAPYALLMEVTGYTPWKLVERLKIRDAVREMYPDCKIVLIVDENAEKAVAKQVKQAKKDGLIDQFIYGSISASYLADIVDSL
jgi:nitrogen regulatory protein PII